MELKVQVGRWPGEYKKENEMSELSASQRAIQLDKLFPHLNNHEIVLELAKIEERLDALEAKQETK